MIKDITIGQYFPYQTPIHKLDARLKLLLTIAFVVSLFVFNNIPSLLFAVLCLGIVYLIAKIPLKMILKSLRPILPIVIFTSVLNMFFISGEVLWHWWILSITKEGIYFAILMSIRITTLLAGTSLLTYTTSPVALTDAIERLLKPLKVIKVPVHELAMMMTIALRFIPTLVEETDKIMSAQKARGADMESGNLITRVRAMVPILVPLFISAFRRADDLALAMECRCYHGGEGRTRLKQMHFGKRDYFALLITVFYFAGMAVLAILL